MPGHNNWITYLENESTSYLKFDFSGMQTMNKQQSIEYTAQKIYDDHGDNIYLALSGGLDSEFVANCLKSSGKQFKVILVDYITNRCELWYARKWCYENGVVPEIITLSFEDLNTKLPQICEQYKCTYIGALDFILKDYVEEKGGKLLSGGPEPFSRIDAFSDDLTKMMSENLENTTIYFKFCQIINNSHPYKFVMYTPEMLYNIVKEMEYDKPIQIALANYYGVDSRPKIHFSQFWPIFYPGLKEIALDSLNSSYYKKIPMGTKQELITAAEARQEYHIFA